jgi:glycine/serine hydroxymethyltransferase
LIFQSEEQSDIPYDDFRKKVLSNLKNNTEVLKKIEMEVSSEGTIGHRFKNKLLKSGVDIGLEILKEVIPGGGIALKAVDILIKQFSS